MFTEKAQAIIDAAKGRAAAQGAEELELDCILAAVGADTEAGVRLADCLTHGDAVDLRGRCPELGPAAPRREPMPPSQAVREMTADALRLASADGVPDRNHPGQANVGHLCCSLAMSRDACRILGGIHPMREEDARGLLAEWAQSGASGATIGEVVGRLRGLRQELLSRIFGQDHAVHAFVEGLYNAEVTAAADRERKRPAAVFVFAGPPGVGKTYMSELSASHLDRPFRRFDMTGFTDQQSHNQLVGFAPSYSGAQAGMLTGFVEKSPNAVLLFDEIEKAHLNVIQFFYQILDAGRLEDKFLGRDVPFRDTIIIFTTNAGRDLYDNPNKAGIGAANAGYHRRTILSALENEKNPQTGKAVFPPAICSRLAQGYPVLFNHLGINELERVAGAALARTEALLERQYFKGFEHDSLVPISLVLREGGLADARQVSAEAEKFLKTELFKFASLYARNRVDHVLEDFDTVRIELTAGVQAMPPEIATLYECGDTPRILLVASPDLTQAFCEHVPEVAWDAALTAEDALDRLGAEDFDLVLLDIWIREREKGDGKILPDSAMRTVRQGQDYVPLSARALDEGRDILRRIHERHPAVPIYLLSFEPIAAATAPNSIDRASNGKTTSLDATSVSEPSEGGDAPFRRPIDEELFLACVRAGGARGLLTTGFVGPCTIDWQKRRERFAATIAETARRLYREKKAREMAQQRQVLAFDTSAHLDHKGRQLLISLREFRLSRAIDAADAAALVDDVQRPNTTFEDVIGADEAKEELRFFVEYLRNPKQMIARGLVPPKGILLHGPPGTGKTMLARALAGESNCAFIERSASNFVTIWQGSGPQNIRDLFERARRYAPAIVFIDEIDAIGKTRTGGAQAEENTLNALLTEMDGFGQGAVDRPVFVLAATNFEVKEDESNRNRGRRLDPALVRRFSRKIRVDLPDRAARALYLRKRLAKRRACSVSESMVERVAERSPGMSIAALESIIEAAAREAVKRDSELNDELLDSAFETVRFGAARERDPDAITATARHEAGHVIMYWLAGWWPVYVTVVSRGGHGGYMQHSASEREDGGTRTRAQLLADIRTSLGGRAAEIVYYGPEQGLSTGASQDLENATWCAREIACCYGMDEEFGHATASELFSPDGMSNPVHTEVHRAASRILKQEMANTLRLLEEHKQQLHAVAEALIARERLTADDLKALLPEVETPPRRS